jgi:hypothetical protein
MTTADVARILGGVSSEFVRGEILAGRLEANITKRNLRNIYRITPEQFESYRSRHWTRANVARGTSTQDTQQAQ